MAGLNLGNYAGYGLLAAGGVMIASTFVKPDNLVAGANPDVLRMGLGVGAMGVGAMMAATKFE